MRPLSLSTQLRLSALGVAFAWVGVDAQTPVGGASSICDGSITVTSYTPYTVTVYTTGTFNASSLIPDATSVAVPTIGTSSLPAPSSLSISGIGSVISTLSTGSVSIPSDGLPTSLSGLSSPGTSGVGSIVSTLSTGSISLPSDGLPTSLSTDLPSASSEILTGSFSVPSVSVGFTAPGLTTPSSITPGVIATSDLASVLTTSFSSIQFTRTSLDSLSVPDVSLSTTLLPSGSLPTLSSLTVGSISDVSLSGSSVSLSLPALTTSFSTPSLSLPGGSPSLTIPPVSSTPSITLDATETSLPMTQLSSLSNVRSASVTLPAASLSSGLTTLIQSSGIPSLSLQTPSLSSLLSLSGIIRDLSTSLAIPTGLSISLSSATALPDLPSTSPSSVLSSISLSSISLSLPGGVPTLLPTAVSTRTTSSASPIPTASVLALVYCPYDNGLTYLSPGSRPYGVECYSRRVEDALSESPAPDLESCMDSCDNVPGCLSVSYNPSSGTCSYGDENTTDIIDSNYLSGTTTDLSCPDADYAQYMDYTGSIYQVFCDVSFPQSSNITTAPGDDYLDCSDTCSSTATCTGFSYSDGLCTFTQGFGNPPVGSPRNGTHTVVKLAKRAVEPGPDGKPIVKTIPVTSIPSISGIPPATSLSAVVSQVDSLTATLLPPATSTDLPSSLTILPSSLTILPTTFTLPTITSIDVSSFWNATTISLPSITALPSTLTLPTITSVGISSLLGVTTVSILTPGTPPYLSSLINSILTLPSATVPTSQGPTQTPVSYTCPGNDGRIIIENGLTYLLNCSSSTDGTSYSSKEAAASFNDCFRECDQSSVLGGANYCTAFTYEGAENGAGSGTCYLFNGVTQGFRPTSGKTTITAIRAVNYVPGAVLDGASSLTSALPGLTSLVPSISLGISVSATLGASVTIGAGVGVETPSLSVPLTIPTSLSGVISNLIPTSSPGNLVTIPTPPSNSITATCDNGGNILNGCIAVTATLDPGVGVSGGIGIGPSSSPILAVSLSASLGVSVSAGVDLGVGLSAGSSGLSLGLDPSTGLGGGVSGGLGGGLGLGGSGAARTTTSSSARTSATPGAGSPALSLPTASTTSFYVTPLGPVVTTTPSPSLSTTTVYTTSTITSCLTGLGGVLTCPIGGLFTTLPSTSGAVTSISTSIQTSISVSVSISYITVTASSSTSSSRSSSFSTITTFSSRTSSTATSSTATVCRGVVNALGVCVL